MNRIDEIKSNLDNVGAKIAAAAIKAHRSPDEITLIVVTKPFRSLI